MILYHGSKEIVNNPKIIKAKYNKDFYYGFYCTLYESQAIRWATRITGKGIINQYEYTPDPALKILSFSEMTEEWLDFIAACRNGIPHSYDIVEGPMANDTIFNYVEDFIEGRISREAFWELAKIKHPTHQICFNTENALKTLRFTEGREVTNG